MIKAYLSSKGIYNRNELCELIGKDRGIKTAWIANAFEQRPSEEWKSRRELVIKNLEGAGLSVSEVDLKKYIDDPTRLKEDLLGHDLIWVSGGDLSYLRTLMAKSGFDATVKELVGAGIAYGGDSAGAIVAGPILEGFEQPNQDGKLEKIAYKGLDLVQFVPLPHWGREKFQSALDAIKSNCDQRGLSVGIMSDDQAIVVDGEQRRLINNPVDG